MSYSIRLGGPVPVRVRNGLITTTIFLSTNLPVLKGVIEADVVRQGRVYSEGP